MRLRRRPKVASRRRLNVLKLPFYPRRRRYRFEQHWCQRDLTDLIGTQDRPIGRSPSLYSAHPWLHGSFDGFFGKTVGENLGNIFSPHFTADEGWKQPCVNALECTPQIFNAAFNGRNYLSLSRARAVAYMETLGRRAISDKKERIYAYTGSALQLVPRKNRIFLKLEVQLSSNYLYWMHYWISHLMDVKNARFAFSKGVPRCPTVTPFSALRPSSPDSGQTLT